VISVIQQASIPWFYSSNTTKAKLSARLAELTPVYKAYTDIGGRIGQVLEIAVYRALSMMPDAKFFGRYLNLDEHDDSTMYKKEEPPQHIGVRAIDGDSHELALRPAGGQFPPSRPIRGTFERCVWPSRRVRALGRASMPMTETETSPTALR
jgi:hypothetical protein